MKRLAQWFGVDYTQWRALVQAQLLVDYAAIRGAYGDRAARRAIRDLIFMFVGFGLLGAGSALLIWAAPDLLMGTTAAITTIGGLVAFIALHESTAIVAPSDYELVASRPVTSRTYFAVRSTVIFWRTCESAITAGYLPCIAVLTRRGGTLTAALVMAFAILTAALAVTSWLVASYGWLMQRYSASGVRLLTGVATAVAAGVFTIPLVVGTMAVVDRFMPSNPTVGFLMQPLPRTAAMLAFPPVWFASLVLFTQEDSTTFILNAAALSAVIVLASSFFLRGKLSETYAARLAEIGSIRSTSLRGKQRPWRGWLRESRAVLLLAESQLKHDTAIMTEILSLLGILIVLISVTQLGSGFGESLRDPFAASLHANYSGGFAVIYLCCMLPLACRDALVRSGVPAASWIFFSAPVDRVALVAATRKIVTLFVLFPSAALVAVVLAAVYGNIAHSLLHVAVLASISYLVLQVSVMISPEMPFSEPAGGRRNGLASNMYRMAALVVAIIPMMVFERLAYPSMTRTLVGLAILLPFSAGLSRMAHSRLAKRTQVLEYAG